MGITTATSLFQSAFLDQPGAKEEFLLNALPEGEFIRVDLADLNPKIQVGHEARNCRVWVPKGSIALLRRIIRIAVYGDVSDCELIFFRMPDRRSSIQLSLKGSGHRGVFLSQRRMSLSVKMVHRDCRLTIGENTYIGGASIVLLETHVSVGAGGLWSDGILLQGSDSHGIVDLDTMSIVNGGPAQIKIARRVWLGRRSAVMKNVKIGRGSIVASGAIVTKDVPSASAVAGVPAKVVRSRVSWSQSLSEISRGEKQFFTRLLDNIE